MKSSFKPNRAGVAQSAMLAGLVVLVLGGVALASVLQLLNLKQQLADKHAVMLAMASQNDQLQEQLEALQAERRTTEERLETLKIQLLAKTGEIDQLRRALSDVQAKYEVFEFEKTRLTADVERLTQERDDVTSRVLALEAEKKDLDLAAVRFRERFALLDRDYRYVAAQLAELERGSMGSGIQPSIRARMDPSVSTSSHSMAPARRASAASHVIAAQSASSPPGVSLSAPPPAPPSPVKVTVSSMAPGFASAGADTAGAGMAQTIELPPIVVRKDDASSPRGLRGRVVETNRGHQFIVVDRGAQDGVLTGMTFDIQRGRVKIAQATAVRVRPQLTACEVAPAPGSPFPQVGDAAVQRTP